MARNIKAASTASTMNELTKNVNKEHFDEWKRFLEIVEEQKKTRYNDKGCQIWVDSELKRKLELLKINGLGSPIRYMLNAALKVFLEANEDEISKYLR